jgi:hypothetical protein
MRLSPDQKLCLEELYLVHLVATDQLKRVPGVLNRITSTFNGICATTYEPEVLHRYMMNRRKNADWPKLGTRARKFEPAYTLLTSHQLAVLENIYVNLDVPSDEYLFSPDFARSLVNDFAKKSGTILPAATLIAVIFAKRKRGEWVCIREEIANENKAASEAFSDIKVVDQIFKKHKKPATSVPAGKKLSPEKEREKQLLEDALKEEKQRKNA